jgi:hypothetical protein
MKFIAWYKVLQWEIKSFRLRRATRGWISEMGLTAPPNPSLQEQHRQWVEQLWRNRKRKAAEKVMDLCQHTRTEEDEWGEVVCLSCDLCLNY